MERKVKAYPVIMIPEDEWFVVVVPDLNVSTQGKGIEDAIFMARDVIGITGITLEDMGKAVPEPNTVKPEVEAGGFITYVDVDFAEYRMKNDNRKVKKNCTIPYGLSVEAEKAGINFSKVLTEALQIKLQIK